MSREASNDQHGGVREEIDGALGGETRLKVVAGHWAEVAERCGRETRRASRR